MQVEFVKMHSLGNDFVFVEDLAAAWDPSPQQVEAICDRHFGVGADGLILVRPAAVPGHDGYMHYFNADGSLAEMCGNGVRCFAKYLVDNRIVPAGRRQLVVDAKAGAKPISFQVDDAGKMTVATVDMGEPVLDPALVPCSLAANAATCAGDAYVREASLESPWGSFAFTCIGMGNPHAVCFLDNLGALPDVLFKGREHALSTLDVAAIGAFFESHTAFPAKAF
jgi:diaminopimelate epimerase